MIDAPHRHREAGSGGSRSGSPGAVLEPGPPTSGGTGPASELERILGCPRSEWTDDRLADLVIDGPVRLISLMHVGGDGLLKTLDFAPASADHARDIIAGGERADGSSLFASQGIRPGASDIVLRPRVESAFLDPFSPLPTLAILCGHVGRDGRPLPESPDTIVRRAHERLISETAVDLQALGEIEFFLGKRAEDGDLSGASESGYHATSPFVFGEELRRRALGILGEIGVGVKYGHGEVGHVEPSETDGIVWEQHEIELALSPLPAAAEAVVLVRWVLGNLAHRSGMRCSFDPIVRRGHAGNGLHFHFSPVVSGRHAGGKRPDGSLSEPGSWLVAGLVKLAGALMAFGNRGDGSFVRLTQGKETPGTVSWGEFDRSALVRLPILAMTKDGRATSPPTIEFRLPDGSAHPHLLLAGVAQAMIHGRAVPDRASLLSRTAASAGSVADPAAARIPASFSDVAEALTEARPVLEDGEVFPPALIDRLTRRLRT